MGRRRRWDEEAHVAMASVGAQVATASMERRVGMEVGREDGVTVVA
jgi:hypothetical protein